MISVRMVSILIFLSLVSCQIDTEIDKILEEVENSSNQKQSNSPLNPDPFVEENSDVTGTEILNLNNGSVINQKNIFSLDPVGILNNGTNTTDCKHECVPFYECKNGTINTSGETIIDIRVNDGPCGNPFLTCCKHEDVTNDRFSPPASTVSVSNGCGYRNPDGVGLTITGAKDGEAQFAEFPWMVSVRRELSGSLPNLRPSCGGALINPQAVITAAHCVIDNKESWIIRAGEWDINRSVEPYPFQEVAVESITIHKDFYSGALFNDIAFLYLKYPLNISENVNTLCLPQQNYQHKQGLCYSMGWGRDKFGPSGKYHVILKKVELPFVPRDICQENLRKTRLGRYFLLHESFMCAGGIKGKDACHGDGGSPLVCPLEKEGWRYYHAGIVAWGIGCGEENVPGVYVDIAKFRDWIDTQMKNYNLETVSYDNNVGLEPRF